METHHTEIENAGLRILAVGQGKVRHACRYCAKLAPSITCLSNEDDALYFDYGMIEGSVLDFVKTMGTQLKAGARAAAQRHAQTKATGNTNMIPGTFIVNTSGVIELAHYNKFAGDLPDIPALLAEWM